MIQLINLDITYDTKKLWQDCLAVIGKYGWGEWTNGDEINQICLTHPQNITDPTEQHFFGCGSLPKSYQEKDFSIFNKEWSNTYLEEVYQSLPFKIGRFRLMRMKRRMCYGAHFDETKRIHLPLVTNPDCMMIFPRANICFHLPIGHIYLTDTTQWHTAINAGETDRVHLVGALI